MAQYTIRTWHDETITKHFDCTRATRPAAFDEAWRQARRVLGEFGKLDTHAAYRVRDDISACDDLMAIGTERSVIISNTGYSVHVLRSG